MRDTSSTLIHRNFVIIQQAKVVFWNVRPSDLTRQMGGSPTSRFLLYRTMISYAKEDLDGSWAYSKGGAP